MWNNVLSVCSILCPLDAVSWIRFCPAKVDAREASSDVGAPSEKFSVEIRQRNSFKYQRQCPQLWRVWGKFTNQTLTKLSKVKTCFGLRSKQLYGILTFMTLGLLRNYPVMYYTGVWKQTLHKICGLRRRCGQLNTHHIKSMTYLAM